MEHRLAGAGLVLIVGPSGRGVEPAGCPRL